MTDINEILAAVDKIEAEEKRIKAAKKKLKDAQNKALRKRREEITKALNLREHSTTAYYAYTDAKKVERRYVIDQIAKAHAAGRIKIVGLDDE